MAFAANGGLRIHYEVEGAGPAIVLVHGGFPTGSLDNWRERGYVSALKDEYQLVLMDIRGHGDSDKPHAVEDYDIQKRASDVIAVLDDAGVAKAHYLGYSAGGRMGYEVATLYPNRLLSVCMGGAHPQRFSAEATEAAAISVTDIPAFVTDFGTRVSLTPERRARLLRNDGIAQAAFMRSLRNEPSYEDFVPLMPCLLFGGENDDRFLPGAVQAFANRQGIAISILPGLNHLQAGVRSDLVVPIIREFFRGVTATE